MDTPRERQERHEGLPMGRQLLLQQNARDMELALQTLRDQTEEITTSPLLPVIANPIEIIIMFNLELRIQKLDGEVEFWTYE